MNKKALSMALTKSLIIGLIFLLIILLFHARISEKIKNQSNKNLCKASVYSKTTSGLKVFKLLPELNKNEYDSASDVDCPTEDILIKEDLDTEEGNNAAKYKLAKSMYDCLDQFGQLGKNKLEIFERKKGINSYCVICHKIEFKNKDQELKNFIPFLDKTYPPGSKDSFLQLLSGYQSIPEIEGFEQNIEEFLTKKNAKEIDTSKEYATTFIYYKQGYWNDIETSVIGAAAGLTLGLIAIPGVGWGAGAVIIIATTVSGAYAGEKIGSSKTADWKSGVMLLPFEATKLKELKCGYLPAKQSE
jgi:hypothetical protein